MRIAPLAECVALWHAKDGIFVCSMYAQFAAIMVDQGGLGGSWLGCGFLGMKREEKHNSYLAEHQWAALILLWGRGVQQGCDLSLVGIIVRRLWRCIASEIADRARDRPQHPEFADQPDQRGSGLLRHGTLQVAMPAGICNKSITVEGKILPGALQAATLAGIAGKE